MPDDTSDDLRHLSNQRSDRWHARQAATPSESPTPRAGATLPILPTRSRFRSPCHPPRSTSARRRWKPSRSNRDLEPRTEV